MILLVPFSKFVKSNQGFDLPVSDIHKGLLLALLLFILSFNLYDPFTEVARYNSSVQL